MSSGFRHPQATPARNYQNDVSMRAPKPPDRPSLPYMRYSRKMWPKVRAENPDVQLWDIGKLVGKMWQETSDAEKSIYQHEYELEKAEYDKHMKNFQSSGFSNFMSAKGRAKNSEKMSRSRMEAGGVVIQPVDEEEGIHEMSTRKMAGIRFERNNRLVSDLFSPNIVTDTRTIVAQHRMDMLKRQAASLAQHQSKLEEELVKLQTVHNNRKRSIEKGSEEFEEELKKVVERKPVVDEAKFEKSVSKWEGKLERAYLAYKKYKEQKAATVSAGDNAAADKTESAPLLRNLVMDDVKSNGVEKSKDDEEKSSVKTPEPAQNDVAPAAQESAVTDNAEKETGESTNAESKKETEKSPEEKSAQESVVDQKTQESAEAGQNVAASEGDAEKEAEKTEEKMEGVEEAQ